MRDNYDGKKSIDEKFLSRRDMFGLEFQEGFVFLEVEDWDFLQFKPYTGVSAINSQSASGDQNLTHSGDEIIYMDKGVEKVLHGSIGIYPDSMRQYLRYPEGGPRRGDWPNLTPIAASNGSDYGYVNGSDSPYHRPTDAAEVFVPPGVSLDYSYYNTDDRSRQPKLNIRFREYQVDALNPSNNKDRNQIKRIMNPGSPMPVAPVGTMSQKVTYQLEDSWGVQPMRRSQVESLVSGGGN